jgi:NADH-quinone oxidoreductase subunit E
MVNHNISLDQAEKIIKQVKKGYGQIEQEDLITLLQMVQESYGYLPLPVIQWISEEVHIPLSRMYGAATFYDQFHLKPYGRNIIRCCRGTACHVCGGERVLNRIKSILNIDEGETTKDGLFTLETVACLGACSLSPVIEINNTYYGKTTPKQVEKIIKQILEGK